MFRTTSVDAAPDTAPVAVPADLIPLSHLALDLPEPPAGWLIELGRRGIEVLTDDIGRPAISRDNAWLLLAEQREGEARKREVIQRAEQRAIEADRQFRAQLWRGVPADHMPPGVAPAAVMLQADRDAQPKRRSVLQEALSNSGTLTFHSLQPSEGES